MLFRSGSRIIGCSRRAMTNEAFQAFARKATAAGNRKTGLLVEAVEGAETIKSGQGGWRMLGRWPGLARWPWPWARAASGPGPLGLGWPLWF